RGAVEEKRPPARELLRGGEVDALVAHEAHRALGGPEHDEGEKPQGDRDAPVGPGRRAAHGDPPSARRRMQTWRSCGLEVVTCSAQGRGREGGPSPRTTPSWAPGMRR